MGWIDLKLAENTVLFIKENDVFGIMNGADMFWHVVNPQTGRTKRVGPVGAKRANYYDKARCICDEYNEKHKKKANSV